MFGIPINIIVYILLFSAIAGGVWHYKSTLEENKRLTIEIGKANATVSALDEAAERNTEIHRNERENIDEIENAPEGDDGPIAPVLRRAIERLR